MADTSQRYHTACPNIAGRPESMMKTTRRTESTTARLAGYSKLQRDCNPRNMHSLAKFDKLFRTMNTVLSSHFLLIFFMNYGATELTGRDDSSEII